LRDCSIIEEAPKGGGFGAAALKMSHLFKMTPKTTDGQSVAGAKVVIPIRFNPPKK
jgi:protein TonB